MPDRQRREAGDPVGAPARRASSRSPRPSRARPRAPRHVQPVEHAEQVPDVRAHVVRGRGRCSTRRSRAGRARSSGSRPRRARPPGAATARACPGSRAAAAPLVPCPPWTPPARHRRRRSASPAPLRAAARRRAARPPVGAGRVVRPAQAPRATRRARRDRASSSPGVACDGRDRGSARASTGSARPAAHERAGHRPGRVVRLVRHAGDVRLDLGQPVPVEGQGRVAGTAADRRGGLRGEPQHQRRPGRPCPPWPARPAARRRARRRSRRRGRATGWCWPTRRRRRPGPVTTGAESTTQLPLPVLDARPSPRRPVIGSASIHPAAAG